MKSVVSERGQTVIPKELREAAGIVPGAEIEWVYKDGRIYVFVMPEDPVRALRGILKGHGTYREWLAERNDERRLERLKDQTGGVMAEGYVLDTSSIVAYLYDEPGADIAEQAIFGGSSVSLPFLALMEVEYKLRRELLEEEEGKLEEKLAVLSHWPVTVVESNVTWRHEAARVKAQGKLSLADAWNAALALLQDAELVHKDPEFESVDGLKMLKLPYDRDATGKGQ